jgi:AAA15 family ATPase/GTPase
MLKGSPRKLNHHVYKVKKLELLKAAAIFGANGAGKSNLVKAISLFREIVISEHIPNNIDDFKFKLNKTGKEAPMYLAIEFIFNDYLYFYEVSINKGKIIEEKLSKSLNNPEKYEILFSRGNQGDKIKFNDEFEKNEENKILKNVIEKSLLRPDQSLIFLLNRIGESQFKEFKSIFDWFKSS